MDYRRNYKKFIYTSKYFLIFPFFFIEMLARGPGDGAKPRANE